MTTDTPSNRDEEIPTPRHDDVDSLPSGQWPHVAMREAKKLFADTPRTAAIIPVLRYHPGNSAWNQALLLARQLERELIRLSAEREKVMAIVGVRDGKYDPGIADGGKPGFTVNGTDFFGTAQQCLEETLAERDKELAEAKATWDEFINCNPNSPFATIEKLTAQLLAAQTVNGKMREALKRVDDLIIRRNESGIERFWDDLNGVKSFAKEALALSPNPTLLDEVKREKEELEVKYNELIMAVARKFPNETRHQTALKYICQAETVVLEDPPVCDPLRQSTRETEEKV